MEPMSTPMSAPQATPPQPIMRPDSTMTPTRPDPDAQAEGETGGMSQQVMQLLMAALVLMAQQGRQGGMPAAGGMPMPGGMPGAPLPSPAPAAPMGATTLAGMLGGR